MFSAILSLFTKSTPHQKLQKQIQQKLEKAVEKQRNGDLRGYAQLIFEVNQLEDQLLELDKEEK